MFASLTITLLAAMLASQVAAHGYLESIRLDGVLYEGFRVNNPSPDPNAIGWSFTTPDEGPELDIKSPDFVCRQGAEPAKNAGKIKAGGNVDFRWTSADPIINPNGWAHSGAIFTYIASCDGDCTTVDKTELLWNKIQESGVVSGPANSQGIWAADVMRENDGWSNATIPSSIAPGQYVIRHEIVSLHRAHRPISEPEHYPGCLSVEVTGGGHDDLSDKGVIAPELYSTSDEQLYGFDFHNTDPNSVWPMPGPKLYEAPSPAGRVGGCRG